jgi:hypothetical protein
VKSILGLVISFAATLLAWWKYGRYLQIACALYLVVFGIWSFGILVSTAYGFAEHRLSTTNDSEWP